MVKKDLSILIPTLPDRIGCYSSLIKYLEEQRKAYNLVNKVQILSILDTKEMTVGEKRNNLFNISCGKYIQFLDDDDKVSEDYLLQIHEGTKTGADVITFRGEYHENGVYHSDFFISNMVRSDTNVQGMMYRRPNHICAVRRDIAAACKFPEINFGEDSKYAEAINKIIKNEHHINKKLYFYMFDKQKSQTHTFK